jgi:hypothetical protein
MKMQAQPEKQLLLWRETSPIWEIVAGEIVVQQYDSLGNDSSVLAGRAAGRADEAADLASENDLDSAGHALIGCAVALALAARAEMEDPSPIEPFVADIAAAISWDAREPEPIEIASLGDEIAACVGPTRAFGCPTLWELAVKAGSFAAGMSPHISRRRQRRDLTSNGNGNGNGTSREASV